VDAAEFELIARRYCTWVESSDELDRDRFLRELERHLAALYLAAIDLPPGDADGPDAPPSMTHDEGHALSRRLSEKLGDADYYRLIFDPYRADPEVTASLAEDVVDIYRDLRDGFGLLEAGGSHEGAVWEWRFGFDSHWGRHAAHSLYAVRVLTRG
jgi:hypothetical protein